MRVDSDGPDDKTKRNGKEWEIITKEIHDEAASFGLADALWAHWLGRWSHGPREDGFQIVIQIQSWGSFGRLFRCCTYVLF